MKVAKVSELVHLKGSLVKLLKNINVITRVKLIIGIFFQVQEDRKRQVAPILGTMFLRL